MVTNKRHIIRTLSLLLLLLLAGGVSNDATAKTVTYHILTLPFTVKTSDGGGDFRDHIRVEALQCTSEETTVGLPDQFKSPLATGYRYWGSATSEYKNLYNNGNDTKIINTRYYIYDCKSGDYACLSNELTAGASVGDYTDIYVTYLYNESNDILDLTGGKKYNVAFTNDSKEKFMCYNRSRNNRVANALGSGLSGEDLASDDFVTPVNDKKQLGWNWSKWGPIGLFAGFKFTGTGADPAPADPYNITIMTSYEGKALHITDKISNVDNTGTVKPYAESTLMSKVGATSLWFDASNNKHYKIESGISDANKWTQEIYDDCYKKFYDTEKDATHDTWTGFYRYESPTMNSFALLTNPKGGYMFVGSKMNQGDGKSTKPTINQPKNNQYYSYLDNYDNDGGGRSQPYFKLQALNSALPLYFYEIRTYTVYVKTHGATGETPTTLSATMKWSDARRDDAIVDHIPDVLRRKYVNYTAYSDAELTNEITSFAQATSGNIYLDYTVSENIPFTLLPAGGDYKDAQWYTMRMDGVSNPKYIAYEGTSNALVVTDGSGNAKGSNTASLIHQGENSPEAMVAFMGDPYELRILNRKACETANANKFIGCSSSSDTDLSTDKTTSDISKWEIVYESTSMTGMLLRQFNTASSTPKYIGLGSAANDKPVTYSETASRIRVVELDKKKYAFHIMRSDKSIAVMATASLDVGKALKGDFTDIPEIIRSPFLSSATIHFYATQADASADDDPTKKITNLPYDPDNETPGVYANIYVRYTGTPSVDTSISFNVTLNAEYIYTSETSDDANIYSKGSISETETANGHFQWILDYSDPYAMKVSNNGKDASIKYIKTASILADNTALAWDAEANATLFIAKQSAGDSKFYEVMVATGDGVDASETYYNIGRNISGDAENTVKLYKNTTYESGYNQLRFRLIGTSSRDVTYHLIDMAHNDLLQVTTRHTSDEAPYLLPQYRSPLVDTYSYWSNFECTTRVTEIGNTITDIYVTYDVNNLVDLKAGQLYLLEYKGGEEFYQEDGSDGRSTTKQKAIYPYVNGDGNFFVYGQEQYDIQKDGASSTRTRWAWYLESNVEGAPKGDPYHVMIKSRQTESYPITNSSEYNAYFMTYKPDGYDKVVTTLGWPGMNSETATEYMVLGSEGQYQLVTTNKIGGERYVVDSFEQYWKTYDTIRRKLLKQSKDDYPDKDDDNILVQSTPCLVDGFDDNRTYLTTSTDAAIPGLGFHSYEKWAYAKRWNGYNNGYSSTEGKHETKKGWEKIEHWYQTVKMGEGYFNFVKTEIYPVLILLDQHGWEIMRKPIPTDPDEYEDGDNLVEILPYNSPMVKEYAFWATAKKRTGFHQYYALSDRIGGDTYTSTKLTDLPPFDSKNVKDKKGNFNDQYVTYIVKDEYAQTYTPKTATGKPFLIEQGIEHRYATTNAEGTTLTASDIPSPYTDNMKAYILNGNIQDIEKWYVKPNANIDIEMGYGDASHTWTDPDPDDNRKWKNKNPNAYEHYKFKNNLVATYLSETKYEKLVIDSLGYFSFSNGFDPYNIQISSVSASSKYMKTNANGATLNEGSFVGSYPDDPGPTIEMGNNTTLIDPKPKWFDSRNLSVTNATFMAVQDAAGNMQLMPRFDHTTRMSEFGTLIPPTDENVATTYTKLYRPEVYEYLIIDNDGKESLRYKTGGDMTPQTPDHFRSPLATNFTYYATATKTGDIYSDITNQIGESLDGATLTDSKVYVRYQYDEEADGMNMLKGNWLTMQLNEKDAIYDSGIKMGTGKPATIDEDDKQWQWKFAENSQPDPYAIYIYNRNAKGQKLVEESRFALLSHSAGDYALAKAGVGSYTYSFLNGDGMNTTTAASVEVESGFSPTSGTLYANSQVKLYNDVTHTFTYKVYTNGGVEAISADQSQEDVYSNDWKPVLPREARTPLLNTDQYRYYEQSLAGTVNDTLNKSLPYLFGLYEDVVYTHYTPYNPNVSTYVVPNVRNATNVDPVARGVGSNDAPVGLDGKRPYNIIWYQDDMMMSDGTSITSEANKELKAEAAYEWEFEGDDPYAIKIKSVGESNKFINEATTTTTTELSTTATPFMLLNKDGYDYGVFAKTGAANTMLSGHGDVLTTSNPTHFIPFALSTFKVIYHLMIKNIGDEIGVVIPYRGTETENVVKDYRIKWGTTLRDLESRDPSEGTHVDGDKYQLGVSLRTIQTESSGLFQRDSIYCYDAGHISLGDAFKIPQAFSRPNVDYDYYIEGVYNEHGTSEISAMNTKYKGLKMTNLGDDTGLLGNIVFVNVVYNFMGGLDTNSGSDFVTGVDQNKWYTFETSDATPMLAEYSDVLKTVSGYATHYTNDYLWTPVGDPYGFKMYNRYACKNLGGGNKVMSTSAFTTDRAVEMVADDTSKPHLPANSVYELLANSSTTSGYFRVHPVANMKDVTQYYIKNDNSALKLNTTPTEWTFGLSEEVMRPYYQAAGYVGGLNATGKTAYETAAAETNPLKRLMDLQDVVYNHDNNNAEDHATDPNYIVHYAPGYYRLHSQPGSSGITTPRYMSGYTHLIESTDYDNNHAVDADGDGNPAVDILPLHFYEVEKYDVNNPTFKDLGTDYTESVATRGDISLVTVDKDPASIFKFTGEADDATMQTQGLYVKENKMDEKTGTSFCIIDIGGGVIALQKKNDTYFLNYNQSTKKNDLKFNTATELNASDALESARWCMKPVQKGTTAGNGEMPLKVTTNNGGDEHYYTTFYAPFDVLLTNDKDVAYIVPAGDWPAMTADIDQYILRPKRIGEYNTEANGCPEDYRGKNYFIPANTPVIIRTKNTSGEVTMALPTTTPSNEVSCVFTGQYLEQMLSQGSDYVFTFGRSYTHSDAFTYNGESGIVTPAGLELDNGVGFYINANNDRESNATKTMWTRNNKYVYGNKIYYRGTITPSPSPSRELTRGIEFIPVVFDDEELEDPNIEDTNGGRGGDGCVYDLSGRMVATKAQVENGTWRHQLTPGIYIINGKKIIVK